MSRFCHATALALVMSAVSSAPARADQIALTSGILDFVVTSGPGASGGLVQLAGDRGFTFSGNLRGGFGAPVGELMPPGTTIALQGGGNGADLQGTATLDGITFPGFGALDSAFGGSLQLTTSPALLPSIVNGPTSIATTFMLQFLFAGPNFSHTLSGSGIATIFLEEDLGFEVPSWRVTGIQARLSSTPGPVPEPATFILIAPGLAWALRRARSHS